MYQHETWSIDSLSSNHTLVISFIIVLLNIAYILWQAHKEWKKVVRLHLKENLQSLLKSWTLSYLHLT